MPHIDQRFPSESEKRAGYWVGFREQCGDAMTYKLLDHEPRILSMEVLLDPRNLLLPTIGLHHEDAGTLRRFPTETEYPYSLHQVQ